jgi:hypothetical protein
MLQVKDVTVFTYLCGFSYNVWSGGMDVGYDAYFVEVHTVFSPPYLPTDEQRPCTLVSQMYFEIFVQV